MERMVRLSVEVRSGTARFRVGVQAENIRKALSVVQGRYSRGVIRVAFPAESGSFLVNGPSGPERLPGHERIQEVA